MRSSLVKFVKYWLPLVAAGAFIFILSSIPSLKSSFAFDFVLRKCAHVTEYFIFTLLLYRALKGTFDSRTPVVLLFLPAVLSVLYAASDEFHQVFVAGRFGCLSDVLIDSIGIAAFLIIASFDGTRHKKVRNFALQLAD